MPALQDVLQATADTLAWRDHLAASPAALAEHAAHNAGANDELFNADRFKPMLQPINPRIGVTIVPDETHLGMIADPPATAAIVGVWRKLAGD